MNETKLLERAARAEQVLSNPAFGDAFEAVRLALFAQIEKCPLSNTTEAEQLRLSLKLLNSVRANLEYAMNQGKIVSFKLEQEKQSKLNPLRNFFR